MIVLGIVWLLLLFPAVVLGRRVMSALGADRTTLSWEVVYLGLLLLAVAGLFLPRPWIALALGWALVSFDLIRERLPMRLPLPIGWIGLVAVAASAIAIGLVSSRDSITYHYDLIYALASNGVTPGLVWIHARFGFLSSWFALPAMFESLGLAGRTTTTANGLLLAIAMAHTIYGLRRLVNGQATLDDRFWFIGMLGVLPLCSYLNLPVSPTPDFAVIIFALVLAWLWLRPDPEGVLSCTAMLIAAGLFTIKLSALPLCGAATLIAWFRSKSRTAFLISVLLSAIMAGGWMAASVITSGYPLFPETLRLFDVPWRVPEATAHAMAQSVRGFAFWGQMCRPESMADVRVYSFEWLRHWLSFNIMNRMGLAGFAVGLVTACVTVASRRLRRELWPLLIAWAMGMAFILLTAPATRFAFGMLTSLPTAVLAWLWQNRKAHGFPKAGLLLGLLVIALCIAPTWLRQTRSERRIARAQQEGSIRVDPLLPRLWQPPLIPYLHYDDTRDIAYLPQPDRSHNRPDAPEWRRATWYRFAVAPDGAVFRTPGDWRGGIVRAP